MHTVFFGINDILMAVASTFTALNNFCNANQDSAIKTISSAYGKRFRKMSPMVTSNMQVCNIRNHFMYVESEHEW